jgi:hypothetical protein
MRGQYLNQRDLGNPARFQTSFYPPKAGIDGCWLLTARRAKWMGHLKEGKDGLLPERSNCWTVRYRSC